MCPTILLVDDSKTMRHVLRAHLGGGDREFVEAESGRQALEVLATTRVDLMVCDVRMDDIDGIEVVRTTRQSEPLGARIPIILVSGDRSAGLRARCFLAGADEFLAKPLDPTELARTVDALLDRR